MSRSLIGRCASESSPISGKSPVPAGQLKFRQASIRRRVIEAELRPTASCGL